jgi:hypothetical protein
VLIEHYLGFEKCILIRGKLDFRGEVFGDMIHNLILGVYKVRNRED